MPWKEFNVMDERVKFVARLLEGLGEAEPLHNVAATFRHVPSAGTRQHSQTASGSQELSLLTDAARAR